MESIYGRKGKRQGLWISGEIDVEFADRGENEPEVREAVATRQGVQ